MTDAADRDALTMLRRLAVDAAAQLPEDAVPKPPISPEAVRELAADLATQILHRLTQASGEAPAAETEGFAAFGAGLPRFKCPGTFLCGGTYSCAGDSTHACGGRFNCPGTFACEGTFSGLRSLLAR
jgi:hypothetical protein